MHYPKNSDEDLFASLVGNHAADICPCYHDLIKEKLTKFEAVAKNDELKRFSSLSNGLVKGVADNHPRYQDQFYFFLFL